MAHIRKQTRPLKMKASAPSTVSTPSSTASATLPSTTLTTSSSTSASSTASTSAMSTSSSPALSILQAALMMSAIVPSSTPSPPKKLKLKNVPSHLSTPSTSTSTSFFSCLTPTLTAPIDLADNSSSSSSSSSSSVVSLSSSSSPTKPSTSDPHQSCTNHSASPSEKLKQLQSLRKKCIHPAQQCNYLFKKGARKGERCVKRCVLNEEMCSLHLKINNGASPSSPRPKVESTKIRINRLCKNKRYFFVKIIGFANVLVQCDGKFYRVKFPRGMDLPVDELTKRNYLIRNDSGTTVWKTLE